MRVVSCEPLTANKAAIKTANAINRFTAISHERLEAHPVNVQRRSEGLLPANGVICRSAGMVNQPSSLINHLGISAGLVAGESTVTGLGRVLGYQVMTDPRFTAMPDTDLQAKVATAKALLEQQDMVFLHIKGPDICAHDHDPQTKKGLLESVDAALGNLLSPELVVGITGDHSTDSNSGRHVGDPVPSLLYSPDGRRDRCERFGEADCAVGGLGRVSATGYLFSMLDAMGFVRNFKASDTQFLTQVR
jgi:2,3-bisphosphoglycerate-independent phosphoglycerate mutase